MNQDNNKKLAQVFHYDLYGKRAEKYDFLLSNNVQTVPWRELELSEPQYFFVAKDFSLQEEYDKGFSVQELFPVNGVGICSKRDETAFQNSKNELINVLNDFKNLPEQEIKQKYKTEINESRDKKTNSAKQNIVNFGIDGKFLQQISYRPFDTKWTYFTNKSKGFLAYPVYEIMKNFTKNENIGLIIGRQGQVVGSMPWNLVFVVKQIVDLNIYYRGGGMVFPLYLYPETSKIFENGKRKPNLNETIINELSKHLELQFTEEKEENKNTFAPIDILDYIYAVLHSPSYRERYKEFLKIDFPRAPYPENAEQFWHLAELGGKLRRLHLMEGIEPQQGMADYPIAGSNEIEKPHFVCHCGIEPQSPSNGKVYINETQYFDNVPSVAWNFYIGGYQPAQKWLKDRKGKTLGYDDIRHYQRIIWVLKETEGVMREVDEKLE